MMKTYLFWIAILALLMAGCRNEDFSGQAAESKREEAFFRNNDENTNSKIVDAYFVSGTISKLKNINDKTGFVAKLSDKVGLPVWNHTYRSKAKKYDNLANKSGEEETDILIVPLRMEGDYLSSLMYVVDPNSPAPKIYTVTNEQLKQFVYNPEIDKNVREKILVTFLTFDNDLFGMRQYMSIPLDLFAGVYTEPDSTYKSFTIEQPQSQTTSSLVSATCTVFMHCKSGVGEEQCDHCWMCESIVCFDIGGLDPDGEVVFDPGTDPGDGGTGGDGDGTGGTNNDDPCSDPSSPWYTHHSCGGHTNPSTTNNTPCAKTKALMGNNDVKNVVLDLKSHIANGGTGEKGWKLNKTGSPTQTTENSDHSVNFGVPSLLNGGYHNHTGTKVDMFSATDISTMIEIARNQTMSNGVSNAGNAFLGLVAPNGVHYLIRFDGDHGNLPPNPFSGFDLDGRNMEQYVLMQQLMNNSSYYSVVNGNKILNNKGLERILFKTLSKMNLQNKVILQKIDDNNKVSTVNKNSDGTTTSVPCP